jgi:sec-independent protein translocase protein TatA
MFGFLPNLGPMEMIVIVGLGVLLFGKRLPEVGRSLGKGIVEFKKGLKGIEDEVDEASNRPSPPRPDDRVHAESPKFEIPPAPTKSERT